MTNLKVKVQVLVTQSSLTLCHSMDCGLPGSSVYGILQARMLEWVDILFSRGSSQPWDPTRVSCIAGRLHLSHQGSPMTNLESILKSRDITLQTKFHIVKVMAFQQSYTDVRVGP